MKLLNVWFEDDDFEILKSKKIESGLDWKAFLLGLVK